MKHNKLTHCHHSMLAFYFTWEFISLFYQNLPQIVAAAVGVAVPSAVGVAVPSAAVGVPLAAVGREFRVAEGASPSVVLF